MKNNKSRSIGSPLKLGLGTVQFGMKYGVTHLGGQVPRPEVCRILMHAHQHGLDLLDTASAYGQAEEVIGWCINRSFQKAQEDFPYFVVTKSPPSLRTLPVKDIQDRLRSAVFQSCARLCTSKLYGYLVHHVDDLLSSVGDVIWTTLAQLRTEGIVEKIGFSAYESDDIIRAIENFEPDIVQLPFNVIDRRLIHSGVLSTLRQRGVEVHARSLFLQGVLLQPADALTGFFAPLAPLVRQLDEIFQNIGLTRLAGLLAAVWQTGLVDRLIIGVTSLREMDDILQAAASAAAAPSLDMAELPWIEDSQLLTPPLWPLEVKSRP